MDILFGLTPPRLSTSSEKIELSVTRTAERINRLQPRAVVLYDIQDEQLRNPNPRPFPFSETHEPYSFAQRLMPLTTAPFILYKCVVKWQSDELTHWLNDIDADPRIYGTVLVGGQIPDQEIPGVTLDEAYKIFGSRPRRIKMGGVAIAERHDAMNNEHHRIMHKMKQGCSFFISQAMFRPDITEKLVLDLTNKCAAEAKSFPPFYMTLTPCGTAKGFEFMEWLGIYVSDQFRKFILASQNPVETSVDVVKQMGCDLVERFPDHPIGFNIESIAKKRSEIEASISLAESMKRILNR